MDLFLEYKGAICILDALATIKSAHNLVANKNVPQKIGYCFDAIGATRAFMQQMKTINKILSQKSPAVETSLRLAQYYKE